MVARFDSLVPLSRLLEASPHDPRSPKALRYIYQYTLSGELSLSGLRTDLSEVVETYETEAPNLAWEARRLDYQCIAASGDIDGAIAVARDLEQEAPTEQAGIYIELDALYLEGAAAGVQTDASIAIAARMEELRDRLETASIGEPSTKKQVPITFGLKAAYPNPFNSATRICYTLADEGLVRMAILDLSGREVARLTEGRQAAGIHAVVWNSAQTPTGLYICTLQANGSETSIRLVLVK